MSEKFKKLKRKYLFGVILKCAVCGISFGLFAVGVILLALKLSAISLGIIWYVIIGAAAAVLGFAVAFIFFRPTDKKVATRLDNDFGLEERVQTSVEYDGQEGTILELQRADTEQKLSNLPKNKLRFSRIWQFGAAALIAVAIMGTAFAVPAKAAVPTGDEAPAEVGTLPLGMIEVMINDVQSSDLNSTLKTQIVYQLRNLIVELSVEDLTQGELKNSINGAITQVNLAVNNSVSYFVEIGDILMEENTTFGELVLRGGNSYMLYRPAGATTIKTYDHIIAFDSDKQSRTLGRMNIIRTEMLNTLNIKLSAEDAKSKLSTAMTNLIDPLESGINALSEEYSENSIYGSLVKIKDKMVSMRAAIQKGDYSDDEEFQAALKNMFDGEDWEALAFELAEPSYVGAMRRFVGNRLKDIFGLSGLEMPDGEDSVRGGNNSGSGDGEGGNNQGPGESDVTGGDIKYGSDDMVYDPRTGEYRKYGDILAEYRAMLTELIESGEITEEQAAMAEAYFDLLYGSTEKE